MSVLRINKIVAMLQHGSEEIYTVKEIEGKFADSMLGAYPLRVKVGIDPTGRNIHFGHAVLLRKARQLQSLGHCIILVLGNATACIGDPTGQNVSRPILSIEMVELNLGYALNQICLLLDPNTVEVRLNGNWIDQFDASHLISMMAKHTVARILERSYFANRLKTNVPVSCHELVYPLLQGYDSVVLRSDIEIGGGDQKSNLLMGRRMQEMYGQRLQSIITVPLLKGINSNEKMSKSKTGCLLVTDRPATAFTNIIGSSESAMWHYYKLCSARSYSEMRACRLSELHKSDTIIHKIGIVANLLSAGGAIMHGAIAKLKAKRLPTLHKLFTVCNGLKVKLMEAMRRGGPRFGALRPELPRLGVIINSRKLLDNNFLLCNGLYWLRTDSLGQRKLLLI